MRAFITLKTKMYHGTSQESAIKILKDGYFSHDTISCATQDKDFARGYGQWLICFDYEYEIELDRHFFENLRMFRAKGGMIGVSGDSYNNMAICK